MQLLIYYNLIYYNLMEVYKIQKHNKKRKMP